MGSLELRNGDHVLTPSAPKLRRLLALLAVRSNHVVTTGPLMEELWGDELPVSALATLQTYIYQLRRLLSDLGPEGQILRTKPLGYMITLDHDELDWNLFQDYVCEGRTALERGDAETAAVILGRALDLSPAPPLTDVEAGSVLAAHVNELVETKLEALELRAEANMRLGRYRELVGELKTLITEHPFHESFYAKLMLSLDRSGRRFEALEVYQQLRGTLVEELGIEPSANIRQLQMRLLAAQDGPRSEPEPPASSSSARTSRQRRPAQLPADVPDFAGRTATVAALCDMALGTEHTAPARLINVTGMVGIGKTAVALQVAHRIRDHFVDGQFYADMRGSTEQPVTPFSVLGRFLRATGVPDAELPRDVDERSEMFRSWTADRKVLVVLDDAGCAASVRPLLPGGRHCTVLVAGRNRLPDLDGAKVVVLEPLEVESCVELLGALIGPERIAREEDMASSIAGLCDNLPLAIRAVGTKLAASPCYPLRKLVVRLSDERRLLRELHVGESDIGVRIARDYDRLSEDARELLSVLVCEGGGSTFSIGVAAAVADLELFSTELLLEELISSCILRAIDLDGHGTAGFSVPSVVRSFVLQRAEVERTTTALIPTDVADDVAVVAPPASAAVVVLPSPASEAASA